eukprot:scaffold5198_cov247-Pinguiococcus_pyrenoidosus.AAC.7
MHGSAGHQVEAQKCCFVLPSLPRALSHSLVVMRVPMPPLGRPSQPGDRPDPNHEAPEPPPSRPSGYAWKGGPQAA